jgi:hypothetical protein
MTPDAQKVEDAYLDAIQCLVSVVGLHDDDGGMIRPASVNLDTIPASVLTAARAAIKFLACGVGLLDENAPVSEDLTPERALAAWTGEGS